ncbi:MAG: clan AA aspartic protease [Bacteroidales bacterium]|nr:clan AA aspartic protease [Bacteroidales bacterium]
MLRKIPITIIPIEDDGFHLMLEILINHQIANLIIDTGASRTVFDSNRIMKFVSDENSEFEKNEKLSTGLGTNSLESQAIELDSIKIGELEIEKYKAVILDMSHINQTYSGINIPEIDGVLGGDLLKKYNAEISYRSKLLVINI